MSIGNGMIVLMGSGELTSTMVEVHKEVLKRLGDKNKAVFVDTPAGFQLNVDEISQKAVDYFRRRIQHPISIASLKSGDDLSSYESQRSLHELKESDFIFIGPGSPTYAVQNWIKTPIPDIFKNRIENGGCLVTASAAALTLGRYTLPVYEIYKVGQDLHWTDGLNILNHFGFNLVVIPHWNNSEGGTHDTRFCYMGEPRFNKLMSMLPEDIHILGLDEHTACIIDLKSETADIRGVGQVTLRSQSQDMVFQKGDRFHLDLLYNKKQEKKSPGHTETHVSKDKKFKTSQDSFWEAACANQTAFKEGLEALDVKMVITSLLELEQLLWKIDQASQNKEVILKTHHMLRESLVFLGQKLTPLLEDQKQSLTPLVEALVELRSQYRNQKKYAEADAIRKCLEGVDIVIEDLKSGSKWKILQ